MTGSIICGVDDSESAKGAARVARELSARIGSRLVFVRVVGEGSPKAKISAVAARLQRLAECAPEVDCGAHWLVELGHPADRLAAVAAKEEASLIVVGSTGPRSSLLGSISADMSRRAPCPVVVVPPGADGCVLKDRGSTHVNGQDRRESARETTGVLGVLDGETERTAEPSAPDVNGGILRFRLDSPVGER